MRLIEIPAQLICYPPGERMAPHSDGCRRLSVLVAGDQTESANEHTTHAQVGSVAIKAPEQEHCNEFGSAGSTILSVLLDDRMLRAFGLPPDALSEWRWLHTGSAAAAGLGLAVALRRGDGRASGRRLAELLRGFTRQPTAGPSGDPRVDRVAERLAPSPFGAAPGLGALAANERLHPASLDRLFRGVHGCSVTTYRQRARVRAVARDLLDGDAPLARLAQLHGFADLSHLSRVFRREVGVAPGRFRDMLKPSRRLDSFKTEWQLSA